tara:strand:+ start:94454 stop:94750 length:297 start_codon:yes stop_codon:yes gene_type:complete
LKTLESNVGILTVSERYLNGEKIATAEDHRGTCASPRHHPRSLPPSAVAPCHLAENTPAGGNTSGFPNGKTTRHRQRAAGAQSGSIKKGRPVGRPHPV